MFENWNPKILYDVWEELIQVSAVSDSDLAISSFYNISFILSWD